MPSFDQPSIAVLCGGRSAEAEVSRVSGKCIADGLNSRYERVELIELDDTFADRLTRQRPDVAFPIFHGPPGEDGTVQGFLDIAGIPYVGSDVHSCVCALDKELAKLIFRARELPVARDIVVRRSDGPQTAAGIVCDALGTDVVIKPARQGSAKGVFFATSATAIEAALTEAFLFDERVLVEECIQGKEITVAILERDGVEALPAVEIRTPNDAWYDFDHRYTPGLSEHIIPAPLPAEQYRRTLEIAREAHKALGCRDLSRVDFIAPERGDPILLEVNALPGFTPTSLYPDAARAAGITFEDLVAYLVERALERGC